MRPTKGQFDDGDVPEWFNRGWTSEDQEAYAADMAQEKKHPPAKADEDTLRKWSGGDDKPPF